jgi:hypothetical protein
MVDAWGRITLFVLDVLAMGSIHLPATSHVHSGLTRYRSVLCIVVGASLGPPAVVRRYACRRLVVTGPYSSSLVGPLVVVRRYASSSGHPRRRWVVTWPVLVVVGGPIHRRWVVEGILIVVGTLLGPTCVHWVSSLLDCPTLRRWVLVPSCWRHSRDHGGGGVVVSYSIC